MAASNLVGFILVALGAPVLGHPSVLVGGGVQVGFTGSIDPFAASGDVCGSRRWVPWGDAGGAASKLARKECVQGLNDSRGEIVDTHAQQPIPSHPFRMFLCFRFAVPG